MLLLKEIERSPSVKEEIYVPASVCGKIVGRCGEAMQEICRLSLAKVSLDSGGRNGGMDKRRIIITGNRQQVNKPYIKYSKNIFSQKFSNRNSGQIYILE